MTRKQIGRLQAQIDGIKEWLNEGNRVTCFTEQKHLDEGSIERVYWHYGRMVALRDVLSLLDGDSGLIATGRHKE